MSTMISDPEAYFKRLRPERSALLQRLETEAAGEDIPIVGPVVGELLYILARFGRSQRMLELGTATGYSAIYLATAGRETRGHLVTLESDPAMARRAEDNLAEAGLASHASVTCCDALAWLSRTGERFDFVFMDIEKEDYDKTLPHLERILIPGGLLVADNVGFQDADPFNRAIAGHPAWRMISLYALLPGHSPLYDGLCLAVRTDDRQPA